MSTLSAADIAADELTIDHLHELLTEHLHTRLHAAAMEAVATLPIDPPDAVYRKRLTGQLGELCWEYVSDLLGGAMLAALETELCA